MKIGLLDIDGHNFPNLALMKISAYHKSVGDSVEFANFYDYYDIVYKSKIFSYTPDDTHYINANEVIIGGTGYDYSIKLPKCIDKQVPDYSLYPKFESAYGFLTRGCSRNCSWCIVPKKEGKIVPCSDIEDILQDRKSAILMDNNILASDYGIKQIEKIIKLKVKVDFNQGLDARLIDRPIAKLLSQVKWLKPLRMSCDTMAMLKYIKRATRYLREYDCKPSRYFVYVMIRDTSESLKRINLLNKWNLDPFAQPYIEYSNRIIISEEQKRLARWVNHKATFKTVNYSDYRG